MTRSLARIFSIAALLGVACGPPGAMLPVADVLTPTPEPTYTLRGQVTLADAADAGGIQVYEPGAMALAMTDEEGRFVIRGLPAGAYRLAAQRVGYEKGIIGEFELPAGNGEEDYELASIELEPSAEFAAALRAGALGSLRGTVALGGGDLPAAGATVELEGTGMRTIADAAGAFYLWNLPAGDYRLLASRDGYEPYAEAVTIAPGDGGQEARITLEPTSGMAAGRGIAGAFDLFYPDGASSNRFDLVQVRLLEAPELPIPIQNDGTFSIEGLQPRLYNLYASGRGFDTIDPLAIDLTSQASAEIRVTLLHREAEAIATGEVTGVALRDDPRAANHGGITVALAGTSIFALTGREGAFRLSGVEPGSYELLAQAEGYLTATLDELIVGEGETVELDPLLLEPDLLYPAVIDTSPGPGASGVMVAVQMAVSIRFNKKMRPETLRRGVTISPPVDFQLYAGREHPQSDFDNILLLIRGTSDAAPVRFDTDYRVSVAAEVLDYDGLSMKEPYTFEFRTGKPSVVATRPANGQRDAQVHPLEPVVIEFNAAIDPRTFDTRQIRIRPSLGATPAMNLVQDPSTGWSLIQITAGWREDTQYDVTVSQRLRTADGSALDNAPYTFTFRTAKLLEVPRSATIPPGR